MPNAERSLLAWTRSPTVALLTGLTVLCIHGPPAATAEQTTTVVPWRTPAYEPGSGCRWEPLQVPGAVKHNAHYLAPPADGVAWSDWLDALRAYRSQVRARFHDHSERVLRMRFDGVRAWLRLAVPWGLAVDLRPGETVRFTGEAKWVSGHNQLCAALDFCQRPASPEAVWQGWSTVLATADIPTDGQWHRFCIQWRTPAVDHEQRWLRPILGMDGTHNRQPAEVMLRRVEFHAPRQAERAERLRQLKERLPARRQYDDTVYERRDLRWMTRNFVCGFVFMYDRSFWDPDAQQYQVSRLCERAEREFSGFDSVVLWHDYPRIGADERNQFDFFRHMPGGLAGLRSVVQQFHGRGVKVFIPYMPWDTGTRREPLPDEETLARIVAAIDADGVFLDTMKEAPGDLRAALDDVKPGVALEPEIHPEIRELEQCSGSWAQWLQPFPGIGVLHLKWLEPRHIQHQIRRWDRSHQEELAAAWLNGSGVLVWENVFGSRNPWNELDRATLRRMAPVLRRFADLLAHGQWLPCFPTEQPQVFASCWQGKDVRLWTLLHEGEQPLEEAVVLDVEPAGQQFFDLWNGQPLATRPVNGRVRIRLPMTRFSAVLGWPVERETNSIQPLLDRQRREASRRLPASAGEPPPVDFPVLLRPAPAWPDQPVRQAASMLPLDGGAHAFVVRHMRRECGCYPDPDTPPENWRDFLAGNPHNQTLEHRIRTTVEPCRIDAHVVTNAQYERFLRASNYQPRCPDRFLHHWRGPRCPPELHDEPVVYVDIDDARAYAAWAGKRLPTEWEWQLAAEQHGDAFQHDEVHEWTESVRDDGHTRFVMLRGGCAYQAKGSIWYFPGGPRPVDAHAKFLLLYPGLDRCATIGFRCVAP